MTIVAIVSLIVVPLAVVTAVMTLVVMIVIMVVMWWQYYFDLVGSLELRSVFERTRHG